MKKEISEGNKNTQSATSKKSYKKKTAVLYENSDAQSIVSEPSLEMLFSYQWADDKNALSIIDKVRSGISSVHFNRIVNDTPFSIEEWSNYLQLSVRTIQRNQKEKKSFQPIQSERIVELTMLYKYGLDVFSDKDNFNLWLTSKSIALGGVTPKDLLDTKFGISLVKDELGRIEHGILA